MFSHNFIKKEGHRVLAVCDEDILGEVLSDGKIKIKVRKEFYGNDPIEKEELLEKASGSTIINAVGNEAVSLLIEEGFFNEDKILEIDGVSHAQMVKI